MAAAQVNHKERSGNDLARAEELRALIKPAMTFDREAVQMALKTTNPPDLELLALLEGKIDSPLRSATLSTESVERMAPQLDAAGLTLKSGVPGSGSLLEALANTLDISEHAIAEWLEANQHARCVEEPPPSHPVRRRHVYPAHSLTDSRDVPLSRLPARRTTDPPACAGFATSLCTSTSHGGG